MNYFSVLGLRVERGLLVMLVLALLSLPLLTPRVAASDEIEYFAYLPSLIFDHDLNFRNQYEYFCSRNQADCISSRFQETFLDLKTATGLQINFAPIGTAVLWLPFYLLGHLVALLLQNSNPAFVANGVSLPYIYAVGLGSLFYGWFGIYLSYRLARNYFDEWLSLAAALLILFATNAVYYIYVAPAFSHAASLFASALFVFVWWNTRHSRANGNWLSWPALGASGGLMTMVREQEAVFFIIPIVEAIITLYQARRNSALPHPEQTLSATLCEATKRESKDREGTHDGARMAMNWFVVGFANTRTDIAQSATQRAEGLRAVLWGIPAMLLGAFLIFIPQLIVYRVLNGNFLPASDVTGKFTWDGAHIGDILFSNFHGLLTWTPIVLPAILGIVLLWRRDKPVSIAFLAALAAETFLLGSFSTWFGGAAFGMRRYINCTVLFVVGLATFGDALQTRVPRSLLAGIGALLVIWNFFFIIQFVTGMVPRQEPVDMLQMARNQFFAVPPRLVEIATRFFTNRGSFYNR